MLLADDVAEMRIGGKGRCFIENRLPHVCTHRIACLVITRYEVLFDLRIRDVFHALRAKCCVAQERGEFEECVAVFGKHIKRIPEQFIGAGTEGIQMPALLERSEEHTSELQSQSNLVCRLLLEKKNNNQ